MAPGNCSCFKYYATLLRREDAQSNCATSAPSGWNGRLAVIPDDSTNSFATGMLNTGTAVWIGMRAAVNPHSLSFDGSQWYWDAGSGLTCQVEYTPPFYSYPAHLKHDCMRIDLSLFEDISCDTWYSYLCEYYPGKVNK